MIFHMNPTNHVASLLNLYSIHSFFTKNLEADILCSFFLMYNYVANKRTTQPNWSS